MVEAVKNLTPINSLQSLPNSKSLVAGQVPSQIDGVNSVFNYGTGLDNSDLQGLNPLSIDNSDLAGLNGINGLNLDNSDLNNSDMYIYGPIAYNKRAFTAYKQQMKQTAFDFENQSIAEEDKNNLQPLSDQLDSYRIANQRINNKENVTTILKDSRDSGIGVGLFLTNCAKDGLKDPNKPISFDNLKNPYRLINRVMPLSLTTAQANENMNLLSDIAVKERSPEMAAILLKATTNRGLLKYGVDQATAKKLLVDSKSKFDNEGDYYKYLTNIDKAYKKIFPGKSLDNYIKNAYKPEWQKLAAPTGTAIGSFVGLAAAGPLGLMAGAAIGGLIGKATNSIDFFGKNAEGNKLQQIMNKARQNSHDVDIQKYTFGTLSSPIADSSLPALS